MSLLNRFLNRQQPEPAWDAAIARRVERDRARNASQIKAAADRAASLAHAMTLGRVTTPMRSRADIAAEVKAERALRKQKGGNQ